MVVLLGAAACASVPPVQTVASGVAMAAGYAVPVGSTAGSPVASSDAGPALFGTGSPQQASAGSLDPLSAKSDAFALVKVAYVSPSAIETLTSCERKWAWSKLDKAPRTENPAALLGTKTHSQHEAWLQFGRPYDLTTHEGEIAQSTLHLLPPPGVANVEGEMTFQANGITLGGKLDGEWVERAGTPRQASHPPEGLEPIEHMDRAVVLDHKTGNKTYFKLSKAQLLGHPQAPIYAARSFLKYQTPLVELRWNYATTTKKPQPFPSWHVLRPEEVHAVWQEQVERPARRLLAIVDEANQTRRSGRPFGALQLQPNFNACAAFGGCAFRSRCSLNGPQEIQAHMSQTNVAQQQADFLKTLGIGSAAPAATPAPGLPVFAAPAVAAPPAPVQWVKGMPNPSDPNWVYDGMGSWMPAAQYAAELAPPVQTSPFPAVAQASAQPLIAPYSGVGAPPAPVPVTSMAPAPSPMAQGYGGQINPPEGSLPAAVVAAAQAEAAPAPTEPAPTEPAAPRKRAKKSDEPNDVLAAVLQGLCANPGLVGLSPEQLAGQARSIVQAVSA